MNIEKRFNRLKLIRNFFSVIYAAVAIIAAPNLLPAAERENTLLESGWRFIQSEAAGRNNLISTTAVGDLFPCRTIGAGKMHNKEKIFIAGRAGIGAN